MLLNQKVDFRTMTLDMCYKNMYEVLAWACKQDKRWPSFDPAFTHMGDVWGADCALWSLIGRVHSGRSDAVDGQGGTSTEWVLEIAE
jgi:hypothetical protein